MHEKHGLARVAMRLKMLEQLICVSVRAETVHDLDLGIERVLLSVNLNISRSLDDSTPERMHAPDKPGL